MNSKILNINKRKNFYSGNVLRVSEESQRVQREEIQTIQSLVDCFSVRFLFICVSHDQVLPSSGLFFFFSLFEKKQFYFTKERSG